LIDILVPVLSRPQNVAPLVASIKATTTNPYKILFLCSPGDNEQIEACRATEAEVKVVKWPAGTSDYPMKMNLGLQLTENPFLLMGADDLTFHDGWDVHALAVAERTGAAVIGTNDLANRQVMRGHFSTHPLVRRSYVMEKGASMDGPGILVSTAYDHNYCDRELCHLAEARGLWAFAGDSHIKHRHPLWRTAPEDSTYARGRKTASEDHIVFFTRAAQWKYVGILPEEHKWLGRAQRRLRKTRTRSRM
jgi:hypothetical protein